MLILVVIVLFAMIPTFIVNCCDFHLVITGNDWIGFFGSYFGAIVGGFITLIVMKKTIDDGKENLTITIEANKKMKKREEDLMFCKDLSDLISEYIQKSTQAFEIQKHSSEYQKEIRKIKNKNKDYEKKYMKCAKTIGSVDTNMKIAMNQEEAKYYYYKLQQNDKALDELYNRIRMPDRAIMIKLYYNLRIRLDDSVTAENLYEEMETILNEYWGTVKFMDDADAKFENKIKNIERLAKELIREIKR